MDLDRRLAEAHARFAAAHPESGRLAERAARVLPGGNTRSVLHTEPYPVRIRHAAGPVLTTVDGHQLVDLLGDYSAGLTARRPEIAEAVTEVLQRGWGLGAMSEPETELAERLTARFDSVEQIRFTNSGSEANLLAVLTARHHTGRNRIVVFEGAYHGGPLTFLPGSEPLRVPFEFAILPYNDPEAARAEFSVNGESIAAVCVEPMLGAGGCIPATPEFLATLREICSEYGALLIIDEVMTSRFAVGGAQERYRVRADLTTLGKYLGGGLSFGAFGGAAEVMAAYGPGGLTHGGTFNNNAFTMAAGLAASRVVDGELLDRLHRRGEALRERLNAEFAAAGAGFVATGSGSLMTIHPTAGPVRCWADIAGVDPRRRALLFHDLLAAGYYVAARGYLALGPEITARHVDGFVAAVRDHAQRAVAWAS